MQHLPNSWHLFHSLKKEECKTCCRELCEDLNDKPATRLDDFLEFFITFTQKTNSCEVPHTLASAAGLFVFYISHVDLSCRVVHMSHPARKR